MTAQLPAQVDDQVVQFPDQASRSWRWISDLLRERYSEQGIDGATIDQALPPVGDIYKRLRDSLEQAPPFSGDDPDKVWATYMNWLTTMLIGMLVEIADREIAMREAGLRG